MRVGRIIVNVKGTNTRLQSRQVRHTHMLTVKIWGRLNNDRRHQNATRPVKRLHTPLVRRGSISNLTRKFMSIRPHYRKTKFSNTTPQPTTRVRGQIKHEKGTTTIRRNMNRVSLTAIKLNMIFQRNRRTTNSNFTLGFIKQRRHKTKSGNKMTQNLNRNKSLNDRNDNRKRRKRKRDTAGRFRKNLVGMGSEVANLLMLGPKYSLDRTTALKHLNKINRRIRNSHLRANHN